MIRIEKLQTIVKFGGVDLFRRVHVLWHVLVAAIGTGRALLLLTGSCFGTMASTGLWSAGSILAANSGHRRN